MAEPAVAGTEATFQTSAKSTTGSSKPPRPPNPVWKMMGLPNVRLRLPSRNWMIFLSIAGSFSTAVIYDKREMKRAQRKWCKVVEHIALEPLDPRAMPRRLTVYLNGPPTDGLRVAQDHFKLYVKPILVSSGLDWDYIQGRKEGDVRAELAERIRKFRTPEPEVSEEKDSTTRIRRQNGVTEFNGPRGDIVIGRHTWKEYVRGLHEGWLGPLAAPKAVEPEKISEDESPSKPVDTEMSGDIISTNIIHSSPADSDTPLIGPPDDPLAPAKPDEKPKKPPQPPPFISTSEYTTATTPSNLPSELDPSVPVHFPHILGFMHTPLRLYRFLNRRQLADSIGRETAAIILSDYRPYHNMPTAPGSAFAPSADDSPGVVTDDPELSEQAMVLAEEEKDWHKAVFKRVEGERERTWIEDMVFDPRIAGRMRRAELTPEDEARAATIFVPEEEIEGWIKGSLRSFYRSGREYLRIGVVKEKLVKEFGDESE